MKKRYKLKTLPKVIMLLLILISIGIYIGNKKYKEYLYTKTYEYAFLQKGYTSEETALFLDKLEDNNIKDLLSKDYNEFISSFVKADYFMYKNLDKYLTMVVTQEQDFFKYTGVDGYDYNKLVATVNTHTNETVYEGKYKTNLDDGYAILVNKYYELGSEYEPDDLVNIDWKYRLGDKNDTKKIRKEVYDAYLNMWNDAYQNNIYLLVDSGYRSAKEQETVYKYYENLKGIKYADSIAARPGYSEHQTGLALDIYSKECTSASKFKDSKTYAWLMENAYKYGFILRYPEGKSNLTGYNYESWHYRYVGVELATKVKNSNLTFDEYYAYYIEKN